MKSPIRQCIQSMRGYVPGEQPVDPGLIKLNTNENPYPPSPLVAQALASLDPAALRLYPDPVSRALRERIAAIHGCSPRQVFAGNGSDEILALCTRAFVEDAGTVGCFDPSYSLYAVLAAIRSVKTAPVDLGEDFEWRMPSDYACSLFFMTVPNAPTGILYPKGEIGAFCRRMPGVVVLDEAYVEFARENCMDLALTMPNVLVMRTLSKSYSLAGLRVGYVVGPEDLIEALFKVKDSYNLDSVAQKLALAALSDADHMRRNVERIKATRRRAGDVLKQQGFVVSPSETNFLWVRHPRVGAESLFDGLRKRRILVRYFPGERTGQHLRITVGTDEQMDALLEATESLTR